MGKESLQHAMDGWMVQTSTRILTHQQASQLANVALGVFISGSIISVSYNDNKGCVLSASWCVGPGELWLPWETGRRMFALFAGGSSVLAQVVLIFQCQRTGRNHRSYVHGSLALASLVCMSACLVVPMSCGALQKGKWLYLGLNDIAHDFFLASSFFFFAVACFAVRPSFRRRTRHWIVVFGLCAPLMLGLVNWCPVLTPGMRALVLVLEIGALVSAQRTQLGFLECAIEESKSV